MPAARNNERLPEPLKARVRVQMDKIAGKTTVGFAIQTEIARMARVLAMQPDFIRKIGPAGTGGVLEIEVTVQPVPKWVLAQRAALAAAGEEKD